MPKDMKGVGSFYLFNRSPSLCTFPNPHLPDGKALTILLSQHTPVVGTGVMCYSIVLCHIYRCLLHYDHSNSLEVPCPAQCGEWVTNFSYDRAEPFQPCQECIARGLWFLDGHGAWQKFDDNIARWLAEKSIPDGWPVDRGTADWEATKLVHSGEIDMSDEMTDSKGTVPSQQQEEWKKDRQKDSIRRAAR